MKKSMTSNSKHGWLAPPLVKKPSGRVAVKKPSGRVARPPRVDFVVRTEAGGRVEYKPRADAVMDEKMAKGAAAVMLIALGVKLPVTITEKDVENA